MPHHAVMGRQVTGRSCGMDASARIQATSVGRSFQCTGPGKNSECLPGTQGVPPLNQSTSTWCCKRASQEGDEGDPPQVATRPECTTRAQDRVETQWTTLDDVCLQEVFKQRFAILQGCPAPLKAIYRHALTTALEAVHTAVQQNDVAKEIRG